MSEVGFGSSPSNRYSAFLRLCCNWSGYQEEIGQATLGAGRYSLTGLFNQVREPISVGRSNVAAEHRLKPLWSSVADLNASARTLGSLSEIATEIKEANNAASAVSVKEVEKAAQWAGEILRRAYRDVRKSASPRSLMAGITPTDRPARS
jgi:hypothetical protein